MESLSILFKAFLGGGASMQEMAHNAKNCVSSNDTMVPLLVDFPLPAWIMSLSKSDVCSFRVVCTTRDKITIFVSIMPNTAQQSSFLDQVVERAKVIESLVIRVRLFSRLAQGRLRQGGSE